MTEFKKIKDPKFKVEVKSQGCDDDCTEIVWAGRTAKEGWRAGCWSTTGNTPRTTTWF